MKGEYKENNCKEKNYLKYFKTPCASIFTAIKKTFFTESLPHTLTRVTVQAS